MEKAQKILIAGFGDIGERVARKLHHMRHYRVMALVRKSCGKSRRSIIAKTLGVQLVRGDLSKLRSLQKLCGLADTILHFAPPPGTGATDTHTEHLLAALSGAPRSYALQKKMLPRRIVYISTTGVYGSCHGEWIDETRPLKPESARAKRRVDAECRLRKWGRLNDVSITILRAPGIYGQDRLPIDRLKRQIPVLIAAEDVFTNHIHTDDLTAAVFNAMRQRHPKRYRVFNVVDDNELRMGDYMDAVADAFGVARPPRISRPEAEGRIAPMLMSFMRESRRIRNARVKRELKLALKYPTLASVLAAIPPTDSTPLISVRAETRLR